MSVISSNIVLVVVVPVRGGVFKKKSCINWTIVSELLVGEAVIALQAVEQIHSFIPDISKATLQVLYYSTVLPTTALILHRN